MLGEHELEVFRARSARVPQRGISYLATRFSAKEAFSKAIGLGMRMPMTWRACEVVKAASGKPEIRLHGALADWFARAAPGGACQRQRRKRLRGGLRRRRNPGDPPMTSHAPVVLDIAGTTLSRDDRRRLTHPLTGGLILFARNWVDRRQLIELTSAHQGACAPTC